MIFHWVLVASLSFASRAYGASALNDPRDEGYFASSYVEGYQGPDFSWLEFEALLRIQQPRSVEATLKLLPKNFLAQYVVVYRSRSLQEASPEHPRILLFNRAADLVVTFNGLSGQRGFENLEVMHFDSESARFNFREVGFLPNGPHVSSANPPKCLACHQSPTRQNVDPRPNWEPYSFWPGVLGSNDGFVKHAVQDSYHFQIRRRAEDADLLAQQARESEMVREFKSAQSQHPRYGLLGPLRLSQGDVLREPVSLTDLLARLNAQRIVRLIRESGALNFFDAALVAAIRCSFEGWLAPEQRAALVARLPRTLPRPPAGEGHVGLSDDLTLLFEVIGLNTEDWSMDFQTRGRFAFRERLDAPSNLHDHFRRALNWQYRGALRHESCGQLKSLVQKEVAEVLAQDGRRAFAEARHTNFRQPPLINACIRCHAPSDRATTPSAAPWIPFDQPRQLVARLTELGYPRGSLLEEIEYRVGPFALSHERMPLGGAATPEQAAELLAQLKSWLRQMPIDK